MGAGKIFPSPPRRRRKPIDPDNALEVRLLPTHGKDVTEASRVRQSGYNQKTETFLSDKIQVRSTPFTVADGCSTAMWMRATEEL